MTICPATRELDVALTACQPLDRGFLNSLIGSLNRLAPDDPRWLDLGFAHGKPGAQPAAAMDDT